MRVLFLGANSGTSRHRANAIERLGHSVRVINPDSLLGGNTLIRRALLETGGIFAQNTVKEGVLRQIAGEKFDFVWVDGGRYVGPGLIKECQQRFGPVINYNVDDPLGKRDRFFWMLYQRSIPFYDLIIVVRPVNIAEARAKGAKKVLFQFFRADEIAHAPQPLTSNTFQQDVVFVGTFMENRGQFMAQLISLGVPLSIYGDRWQRAPEWAILKDVWKGPGTKNDEHYARLIQSSKICLGMLSKGNRDHHTTRSMEIPSLGALLCAERTDEHLELYRDGVEAVFWNDVNECARLCLELLQDDSRRAAIALNGHKRCLQNGHFNESLVRNILTEIGLGDR